MRDGDPAPFEVVTIGLDRTPVTAYGGLRLIPETTVGEISELTALVVPGAIAIDAVLGEAGLVEAVRTLAARTELVASVCTGAFLLGDAGLLEGRRWTTHWEDVGLLAERLAGDGARRGVRWVDAGAVVTSGGLASGIAMALHLVSRLAGRELAERTARQLDYDWDPTGAGGRRPGA